MHIGITCGHRQWGGKGLGREDVSGLEEVKLMGGKGGSYEIFSTIKIVKTKI